MRQRTTTMKIVLWETMSECVAMAMGSLSTRILQESEKPNPDSELMNRLREELFAIKAERDALDPRNEESTEAMLKKYAPKLHI
jgi:hypothetical protein